MSCLVTCPLHYYIEMLAETKVPPLDPLGSPWIPLDPLRGKCPWLFIQCLMFLGTCLLMSIFRKQVFDHITIRDMSLSKTCFCSRLYGSQCLWRYLISGQGTPLAWILNSTLRYVHRGCSFSSTLCFQSHRVEFLWIVINNELQLQQGLTHLPLAWETYALPTELTKH